MAITKTSNPRNPWQVDYRDGGKRYRRSFPTKREAERFDSERKAGKRIFISSRSHEKITVKRVHASWWEHVLQEGGRDRAPLAPHTATAWAYICRAYVLPQWGDTQLSSLNYEAIRAWTATMASVRDPEALAGTSTRYESLRLFRKILNHAVLVGFLEENPCLNRLGKVDYWPKSQPAEKSVLSASQITTLADALGQRHAPSQALALFMGTSGPRPSEAVAVTPADFKQRNGQSLVTISKTVQPKGKLGPTKSRKSRTIPVTDKVMELIDLNGDRNAPVFPGVHGGFLNLIWWRKHVFNPSMDKVLENHAEQSRRTGHAYPNGAGQFPRITPHGLRHSAITNALNAGVPIEVVQAMAGHASLTTTLDIYNHLTDQDMVDAATILNRV